MENKKEIDYSKYENMQEPEKAAIDYSKYENMKSPESLNVPSRLKENNIEAFKNSGVDIKEEWIKPENLTFKIP